MTFIFCDAIFSGEVFDMFVIFGEKNIPGPEKKFIDSSVNEMCSQSSQTPINRC